ncbi:MAG: hypothetical protein U1E77_06245 [Inhella sp.]
MGAKILADAKAVFEQAEMIVMSRSLSSSETAMLKKVSCCSPTCTWRWISVQAEGLMKSGCTAIAYATITDSRGGLLLLAPMSEVAGRMAIQVGAVALQKAYGGRGARCWAACLAWPWPRWW